MYLKKLFTKSLLVAAGLCAGANAVWADDWSVNFATIISESGVKDKTGVTITDAVVTINGTGMGTMSIGTVAVNSDVVFQKENWLARTGGYIQNQSSGSRNFGIRNCTANQTITLKTGNAAINSGYNATLQSSGNGTYVYKVTADGDVSFQFTRYIYLYSITVEDPSATAVSYTVKFQDSEGNTLKNDVTYDGEVGAVPVINSSDKADIYANGNKYVYDSDNASEQTIASDGSTVVIIKFVDAGKYTYTLNAVDADDNVLKELSSGNYYAGDTYTAYYPKAIYCNDKWYSIAANGSEPWYGVKFTEAATKTVKYTEDATIAYFFDVENLSRSHSWAANGNTPGRYSNGSAGRLYQASYAYTEPLEGGVYTLTMWARNNGSSTTANMDILVRDAEGNDGSVINFAEDWDKGGQGEKTIENITIPTGSCLVLNNPNTWNHNLEMDYIILVKTGEAPAVTKSVTMGANGYATYASKNALDLANLPEGLKAYTATLSGIELSFNEKSDAAVAPGTGLLLKGDANETYEIPVAATGAAVSGNALIGVTADTDMQSNADGSYIFVMKKATAASDELTFLPLTTEKAVTVPAGKAYVEVAASAFGAAQGVRALRVVPIGATTGIGAMTGVKAGNGEVYNLQGQRVEATVKGLYIVNGKKIVVK